LSSVPTAKSAIIQDKALVNPLEASKDQLCLIYRRFLLASDTWDRVDLDQKAPCFQILRYRYGDCA